MVEVRRPVHRLGLGGWASVTTIPSISLRSGMFGIQRTGTTRLRRAFKIAAGVPPLSPNAPVGDVANWGLSLVPRDGSPFARALGNETRRCAMRQTEEICW